MADKPKPMTLRERAAQMQHTWDSDEGDQWVKDALDQLDEMAASHKQALDELRRCGAAGYRPNFCVIADGERALARYEGRDE